MKTLVIYAGGDWRAWDWRTPEVSGVGGSETAAINMARELSQLGYRCKIFANTPADTVDPQSGTEYRGYRKWESFAAEHACDILICLRNLTALEACPRAARVFAWMQDIDIVPPPGRTDLLEVPERFFVLTKWHHDYTHRHMKIPTSRLFLTSNGVNPLRYQDAGKIAKDRCSCFYSSSPERGLDRLLDLLPAIRRQVPEFKVHVLNDAEVADQWVATRGTPEQKESLFRAKLLLKSDGVVNHGRVNQSQLARLQMQSGMWVYPATFPETSCITAMEAGFARCPIVTVPMAGLIDTCGGSGILLYQGVGEAFVDEVVRLCRDDHYYAYWQRLAYEGMRKYTWAAVAQQWHALFESTA